MWRPLAAELRVVGQPELRADDEDRRHRRDEERLVELSHVGVRRDVAEGIVLPEVHRSRRVYSPNTNDIRLADVVSFSPPPLPESGDRPKSCTGRTGAIRQGPEPYPISAGFVPIGTAAAEAADQSFARTSAAARWPDSIAPLHVAAPQRRRLRSGPVDPAGRLADDAGVADDRAGRTYASVAALAPWVGRPRLLDVAGHPALGLGAEVADQGLRDGLAPRLLGGGEEVARVLALDEAEQDAGAPVGGRVVVGDPDGTLVGGRHAAQPGIAPERRVVDREGLDHRPHRRALVELHAARRQRRVELDPADQGGRNGDDDPLRRPGVGARLDLDAGLPSCGST